MRVEFRKLKPMDAVWFRNFMLQGCRTAPEDVGMMADEWGEENSLEILAERFHTGWSQPDQFVMGAFSEGQLVGTLGFSRGNRMMSAHHAYIWGVHVDPSYRGAGIAKSMLQEIINTSRGMKGLEMLRLKVRSTNHKARNLYQAVGFKSVGVEPRVLKWGDTYIDLEWMVLDLAQ
ncbi:GNAT family N-acetyltransferase [Salinithrix halophila]|uniref:GNAT family N-acetyltransferase n=1 Tax=Salinithrix halophila TaxID=1485204 RepID=A0ABV8JFP8_9BACL